MSPTAAPLSAAESLAVRMVVTALVGFAAYGFATGAASTVGYLISVVVVGAVIARFRIAPLPAPLALGLAVAAVVHLAGGLVNVGNDVLYNASIGPYFGSLQTHPIQYDHFAHTYATFVATLTIWTLLARPTASEQGRRELTVLCFLAGIGVGGLNEMIEFLITIVHHDAHVGGYSNTGWDLVVNTVGALGAVAVIRANQLEPIAVAWTAPQQSACIVASAGTFVATIVGVGLVTPGYRPWADAVSRLGSYDEPYALLWRAGFVLFGVLVVAGSASLGQRVPRRERLLARLVAGFGAAAVVAGLAPKDPPGAVHTFVSQVHVASTLVGGSMLLSAMALVARCAPCRTDRLTATRVLALTALAVVVFPFTWGTPVYGVIELLMLTLAVAWLVVLAATSHVTGPVRAAWRGGRGSSTICR